MPRRQEPLRCFLRCFMLLDQVVIVCQRRFPAYDLPFYTPTRGPLVILTTSDSARRNRLATYPLPTQGVLHVHVLKGKSRNYRKPRGPRQIVASFSAPHRAGQSQFQRPGETDLSEPAKGALPNPVRPKLQVIIRGHGCRTGLYTQALGRHSFTQQPLCLTPRRQTARTNDAQMLTHFQPETQNQIESLQATAFFRRAVVERGDTTFTDQSRTGFG